MEHGHDSARSFTMMRPRRAVGAGEVPEIMAPRFLDCTAQETSLWLLARREELDAQTAATLRSWVVGTRRKVGNPVLVLDWDADTAYINHAISPYAVIGNALPAGVEFALHLPTEQ